jgi:hypothetical protein
MVLRDKLVVYNQIRSDRIWKQRPSRAYPKGRVNGIIEITLTGAVADLGDNIGRGRGPNKGRRVS